MGIKKKIGLALGSGGPRGLAHIGIIKALVEHDIPIDIIAGSSAGALIGGVFLALGSISKVEEYVHSLTYKKLAWMFLDLSLTTGIIRGDKIEQYLEGILLGKTIESLKVPFAAVATDLSTGDIVPIQNGLLSHAIRASSAIPVLIDSIPINGKYCVDGGASAPIPVSVVKEMGSEYTIAVNLDTFSFIPPDISKQKAIIPNMGRVAIELLRFNLANLLCKEADCVIVPDVSRISSLNLMEFIRGEEIIQKGYEAGIAVIPKIKKDLI
jgi:NTE family protein